MREKRDGYRAMCLESFTPHTRKMLSETHLTVARTGQQLTEAAPAQKGEVIK